MTPAKKHAARPDPEISRDVLHELKADIDVPDDRVRAKVAEGVVTLSGTVSRDEQKKAAEHCVRRVHGVREIHNLIDVEPGAAPEA